METDNALQFAFALSKGYDSSALGMLRDGRVTVNTRVPSEPVKAHYRGRGPQWGVPFSGTVSMMCATINFGREEVARGLLSLGANIDEIDRTESIGSGLTCSDVTWAGRAILRCEVSMLSLCHRLGADMSCVIRSASESNSAVELAITGMELPCLIYLLDEVYPVRPVTLSIAAMCSICVAMPLRGKAALILLKILDSRGFNFKTLEGLEMLPEPGEFTPNHSAHLSLAANLINGTRQSEDPTLLHFVVKKLGLVSSQEHRDLSLKANDEPVLRNVFNAWPDATLKKYACAAEMCDAVGVTMWCSRCKMAQYCSSECQNKDWKYGGHKKECKKQ